MSELLKNAETSINIQEATDVALRLYRLPLLDLLYQAHTIFRRYHDSQKIEKCNILSVKTGDCPEDCSYCPQSTRYRTGIQKEKLMPIGKVLEHAKIAKKAGARRFCMGAAWRKVRNGPHFNRILEMVRKVNDLGLEVCVSLGMLDEEQACRLKEAGLCSYNHNIDTSREYYPKIITTRKFSDRLQTIKSIRKAGLELCSGGIIGMGESPRDRCAMLAELASLNPQPESVPINTLVPIKGTPLEKTEPIDHLESVRTIAVARILMVKSKVRLAAGRLSMTRETQLLAFFAGANSIFFGNKLLTTSNPEPSEDDKLLAVLEGFTG